MRIFHHNDLDGKCAAAIVLHYVTGDDYHTELIEIDYKDKVDVETIQEDERVVIVDFSFKPEVMAEVLKRTKNVIWLDHHKTAFEYRYGVTLDGLRSLDKAGCELAWEFFTNGLKPPQAVILIGDYDKWALKFQPECFQFYEGMKLFDNGPRDEIWDLLFQENEIMSERVIGAGKYSIMYRDNYCANIRKTFGYEVEFEGHLAYATNFYQFGSMGFGEKFRQYDFVIAYIHDGKKFTVSLYSDNRVDVGKLCQRYGGGGHTGAAGFVCEELPWLKHQ